MRSVNVFGCKVLQFDWGYISFKCINYFLELIMWSYVRIPYELAHAIYLFSKLCICIWIVVNVLFETFNAADCLLFNNALDLYPKPLKLLINQVEAHILVFLVCLDSFQTDSCVVHVFYQNVITVCRHTV